MTKHLEFKKSNTANAPPLINFLPSEVLAHIFQLVLIPHNQPCFLERDRYSDYPNYPEALLRVCSRWRQVALTSPSLWSRIDIVLSQPTGQTILERAKIFVERAGQYPLELRIFDQPIRSRRLFFSRSNDEFSNEECADLDFEEDGLGDFEDGSDGFDDEGCNDEDCDGCDGCDGSGGLGNPNYSPNTSSSDVSSFVTSLPAGISIRSIEFVISSTRKYSSSCTTVLSHCFEGCLPGALAKLVLRVETDESINFVIPSSKSFEDLWLPITTLHISGGICPPWGSNAFKGLTDLRLSRCGFESITETQFVDILRSSPKLQILQFYLRIRGASPLNAAVEPIHLDDLEVLDVIKTHLKGVGFESLTRWIAPGRKPLRLFIWCPLSSESVKNFFRRANVIDLHVRLHENSTKSLEQLIDLLPRLRVLAVDGCGDQFNPRSKSNGNDPSHTTAQIDTLHLQYCGAQIGSLQQMVQTRSIRKLTMWSTHIRRGEYGGVWREEILALCPNVKILKRKEFTPIEDWLNSIA